MKIKTTKDLVLILWDTQIEIAFPAGSEIQDAGERELRYYTIKNKLDGKLYRVYLEEIDKYLTTGDDKSGFFYYQIPEPGKRWEECEPLVMEFTNRDDAVNAAKLLSASLGGATIRFNDNPNYKWNSGSYINYNN